MLPVVRPSADGLVLVDATSAAGGLRVDPRAFDVYYFAPQKCFAADAGVWLALCSPAAIARIERIAASGRWVPPSLDLGIALEQSRLDQTYNTPALAHAVPPRRPGRVDARQRRARMGGEPLRPSAATIYEWADAGALHHTVRQRSGAAEPRHRDDRLRRGSTRPRIASTLRANGIIDVEPYRKLGRNQLRVGLFPAIEPDDVAMLTRAIDYIAERLTG